MTKLARQREDIAEAKADWNTRGASRPWRFQVDMIRIMRAAGISPVKIARELAIARSSVYRMFDAPVARSAA
jgi:hypothetical protein